VKALSRTTMTSLDPTHLPSQTHRSRGAAVYDLPNSSKRLSLPIPDLRFEQSYLKSIARYIHRVDTPTEETEEKTQKEETIEDVALTRRIDNSPKDIYSIEWGKVCYITVRDQVIMPLVQGLVLGIASFYFRPLLASLTASLRATKSDSLLNKKAPNADSGINKLRKWTHNLLAVNRNGASSPR